ncbi:hypothetical protein LCGC14_0389810 [marine sediment metagenome]|uniref:Uncharacterized protein n=1 Tax=marine sediment metagenome TaxID=412755 RepID=A0A0F9T5S9_9ZZZZ
MTSILPDKYNPLRELVSTILIYGRENTNLTWEGGKLIYTPISSLTESILLNVLEGISEIPDESLS